MYISAFLHKEELFEITNRWLSNRLQADDPMQVTRIISYDSFAAWHCLLRFIRELRHHFPQLNHRHRKITTKKELKDLICASGNNQAPRIRHLIENYHRTPEYYYVGSPIRALAYQDGAGQLTGMCRFKRIKRIAEKASRYASFFISEKIRNANRGLGRHVASGPSQDVETTSPAEEAVIHEFKYNGLTLPAPIMTIKDVLGLKIIRNGISEKTLESVLYRLPGTTIVEKEVHSGNYNAIHYVVELSADLEDIAKGFERRTGNDVYRYRGLPAGHLSRDFNRFLRTGDHVIQVDLIFTTFEEMVESEIGRSMHETRIMNQRQQQDCSGNITINIEYIIEYLLAVAMSPTTRIDEIPIKIWGRYLPDALSYHIRKLYRVPEYSIVDIDVSEPLEC